MVTEKAWLAQQHECSYCGNAACRGVFLLPVFENGKPRAACWTCAQKRSVKAVNVAASTEYAALPDGPYDDSQPVLAALESLASDPHATDVQRRIAHLAFDALKNAREATRTAIVKRLWAKADEFSRGDGDNSAEALTNDLIKTKTAEELADLIESTPLAELMKGE